MCVEVMSFHLFTSANCFGFMSPSGLGCLSEPPATVGSVPASSSFFFIAETISMFWLLPRTHMKTLQSGERLRPTVARTEELMRSASWHRRLHGYHTAARSRSAAVAVPTVGRSAFRQRDTIQTNTKILPTHKPSWRGRLGSSCPFCPMTIPNANSQCRQQQGTAAN